MAEMAMAGILGSAWVSAVDLPMERIQELHHEVSQSRHLSFQEVARPLELCRPLHLL